jgi:predicted ATP-binding protein involved in virulence
MRIDRLELRNFKKFAEAKFEFPRSVNAATDAGSFHVLIGENGVGKTSILDALAVALGVWLEKVPDTLLANSYLHLTSDKKRLTANSDGDRTLLEQAPGEMAVRAWGRILDRDGITWGQVWSEGAKRVSNRESTEALDLIWSAYQRIQRQERVLLPIIAYYGAGRTWLSHNQRKKVKAHSKGPANRWEAFYDCLNDRIRLADLSAWFRGEAVARGNRAGRYRPGFQVVLQAVLEAVPGTDGLSYDDDLEQIVVSIHGNAQPLANLSAGERSLFALVADIAIKMVTQNNFLVPPDELTSDDMPLPRVLAQTPGVVLVDELEVHLHPKWQRRAAADLKRIFPMVQFIATTHSPQVIGEMLPEEVCLLRGGEIDRPAQSFGMDSNWILQVLMETEAQDPAIKHEIEGLFQMIRNRQLDEAMEKVRFLRSKIGNSEALQRAASTMERIQLFGK